MRAYVQLKKFLKKTDILHKTCNTDAGFDYEPKTAALNLAGTFFPAGLMGAGPTSVRKFQLTGSY